MPVWERGRPIPIVFPIGLMVTVTPSTQASFEAIEKLPEGTRVLISFDYGPSTSAEIRSPFLAWTTK